MRGHYSDILQKYAMHIFMYLEFKPMCPLTRDEQLKIKETLLMIYRDAAPDQKAWEVRNNGLKNFIKAQRGIDYDDEKQKQAT